MGCKATFERRFPFLLLCIKRADYPTFWDFPHLTVLPRGVQVVISSTPSVAPGWLSTSHPGSSDKGYVCTLESLTGV